MKVDIYLPLLFFWFTKSWFFEIHTELVKTFLLVTEINCFGEWIKHVNFWYGSESH